MSTTSIMSITNIMLIKSTVATATSIITNIIMNIMAA